MYKNSDKRYTVSMKNAEASVRMEGCQVTPQMREQCQRVLRGEVTTAELLRTGRLVICPGCGDAIREFGLYRWDTSAGGRDQVCKEHDHAMDDIRYFAVTVAAKERGGSWAGSVERRIF